jgi:hypothetical protein
VGLPVRATTVRATHRSGGIVHGAEGGPTDLDDLVVLCQHHHRTGHTGHGQLPTAATHRLTPA